MLTTIWIDAVGAKATSGDDSSGLAQSPTGIVVRKVSGHLHGQRDVQNIRSDGGDADLSNPPILLETIGVIRRSSCRDSKGLEAIGAEVFAPKP